MNNIRKSFLFFSITLLILTLSSFSFARHHRSFLSEDFEDRMPEHIKPLGEKVIIVNPNVHAFGAYDANGDLVRAGLAVAGADWCRDLHRRCHTKSGYFRIHSLGSPHCISHKFPIPRGGAPMPYCMYFNGGQALHGSYELADANISHGCVRLHVEDAEWLRYDFVEGPNASNGYRGTLVIVKSY